MIQTFARSGSFPDYGALMAAVTAALGTPGFLLWITYLDDGTKPVLVDKPTAWLAGEISAVQTAVTQAPASAAFFATDVFPLLQKAVALALVDQLNVIRAALPVPLGAITPAQAVNAIRAKAATL